MKIRIRNVGIDLYQSPHSIVGANAVSATIANHKLKFPMISPHQSELSKSEDVKIYLKSPLFQYVHVPRRKNKIYKKSIKKALTEYYKNLITKYPELIADFYYQYYPDYPPNNKERKAILDIQRDAGSIILSDYESDPEQTVDKFESQILKLRRNNSKFIPSPTLDIGMRTIGLFAKKIEILLKHKFQRFNVIYRPIVTYQVNWFDLSQKLLGKNIWCNVVGIPQRYSSNINPISLLSTPFLYGVNSTSLGYPTRIKKKKIKQSQHTFNNTTYYFDEVKNMSESESRAVSINEQVDELKIARKHIIKRTFYSNYIPTKNGLLEALQAIP